MIEDIKDAKGKLVGRLVSNGSLTELRDSHGKNVYNHNMSSKTFDVKIALPISEHKSFKYPHWAQNSSGDLFLVINPKEYIAVQYWDSVMYNPVPSYLTPLPSGTKIEITVL